MIISLSLFDHEDLAALECDAQPSVARPNTRRQVRMASEVESRICHLDHRHLGSCHLLNINLGADLQAPKPRRHLQLVIRDCYKAI